MREVRRQSIYNSTHHIKPLTVAKIVELVAADYEPVRKSTQQRQPFWFQSGAGFIERRIGSTSHTVGLNGHEQVQMALQESLHQCHCAFASSVPSSVQPDNPGVDVV